MYWLKQEQKPEGTGSDTTCSYEAAYGMVWEDLCTCKKEEELGAILKKF
jgi:hypothetical protein